jgi:cytochrome d ubiquinol oxidase subunit II
MGTLWFWIVALMLTVYAVLDGFDLGVGIVYLWVARSEAERRQAMRSIGPVWDGNEVWLLAAGGTLFFAFPLLYASAFSGFYLPLMMVLWLIILRGVIIELRSHSSDAVWRAFFDGLFCFASVLLAIFFGAALANVVRGVPIGPDGYFFLPLWTNFKTGSNPGILDWYTVLGGLISLTALSLHGAIYLALKTQGNLAARAQQVARWAWMAAALLTAAGVPATIVARPESLKNYTAHPIAFVIPLIGAACIGAIRVTMSRQSGLTCFLCSCGYLASVLIGAATGLFPALLPAVGGQGHDLTIERTISGAYGLHVGLIWWGLGIFLALLYTVIVYGSFRGKVAIEDSEYEHEH